MVETASSPIEPVLAVQGVSKSFSGVQALAAVDLTLRRGERLAVIGENGAGKSTLMKILAGVLPLDRGRILLRGLPIEIRSVNSSGAQSGSQSGSGSEYLSGP